MDKERDKPIGQTPDAPDARFTRRTFLQTTAAFTAAATLNPYLSAQPSPEQAAYPENGTLVPDTGWTLTLDPTARWHDDEIYLPEDIHMSPDGTLTAKGQPLPIHAPTGGWALLTSPGALTKRVILPTTVEQHFWANPAAHSNADSAGEPAAPRPYLPAEYRYAAPPDTWTLRADPTTNLSSRSASTPTLSSRPERSVAERPASPPPTTALSSRPESVHFADAAERPASLSTPAQSSTPLTTTAPQVTTTAPPPADDTIPINGAYFGVSWWSRAIIIPQDHKGKRIFLHIRGARLRAEVYLNQQLVGYSIMEELPFECELTHAANPGVENNLAIRITNPFGRFDWVDGLNAKWGKLALYRSHGFGGLDRGMTISATQSNVRIRDVWALNDTIPNTIYARCQTEVFDQSVPSGVVRQDIIDPATGKVLLSGTSQKTTLSEALMEHDAGLRHRQAEVWDLQTPRLYHLRCTWLGDDGNTDTRTIAFGFRTFGPTGLGTNAMFRLNGRRVKLYSSISWGFWGLNGLFPIPELAEKEVKQAKKLGLNCLNFHRNLAKEDVLRAQDKLGLLRYLEPGGGKLAVGKLPANVQANSAGIVMEKPTTEADKFAQRYMFVKCVEMVKAFRSHPSVIQYTLQNEIGADLYNPDTLAILAAMHAEDPSRSVVLNDGFSPPPRSAAQAWYEPWNDKLHRSDEEKFAGWWNNHQGAGDQWYDEFYKSPTEFTYKAPYHDILTEFGEMEGCATPDNHALMRHQITETYKQYGGCSYDLADHEQIDDATNRWLTKWGFRKAFPSTDALYNALGKKCYDTWQNYLENARISDDLDFAVISGWESTAIENHSGIVDNLRNFKSDPAPIAQTLQPVQVVAKQRTIVVALGECATFDLYLLNDTSQPVSGALVFTLISPAGVRTEVSRSPAPKQTQDVFTYLLEGRFVTPKLGEEGLYKVRSSITSSSTPVHTKELWVSRRRAIPELEDCKTAFIGVSGVDKGLRKQLKEIMDLEGCYELLEFEPGKAYAAIITSGDMKHTSVSNIDAGETTGTEALPPTAAPSTRKPEPGEAPATNQLGHIDPAVLDAVRAGTPLLCIPQANSLSDGCARQLADAGAFTFHGNVGDFRAPWMGNWYFVREHPLYAGMPVNQAMGMFYQCHGRQSNGLLVDRAPNGPEVEVVVGYSRDHDRQLGAGTFTTALGKGRIVYHRCPDFHPVLQQRFLANCLQWLTTPSTKSSS